MRGPQRVVLVVLVILVALVTLVLLATLVMHLQVYLRRGLEEVEEIQVVRVLLGLEGAVGVRVKLVYLGISALAFRARVNR